MRYLAGIMSLIMMLSCLGCGTNSYTVRLERTRKLVDARDYETAKQMLASLVRDYPGQPEPYYYLSHVHFRRGNYRESLINLDRAERKGLPASYEHDYLRGMALFRTGDYDSAETSLGAAVARKKTADACRFLGIARYRLSDYAGAVEAFADANIDTDVEMLSMYGSALFEIGMNEAALDIFMKAHNRAPDDGAIIFRTAGLLMLNGVYDEAAALYERIPEDSPFYGESLYNRAETFVRMEDHTGASMLFKEYLLIKPHDPEAMFNLASCHIALNEFVPAIDVLEDLVDTDEYRLRTLYNLGVANYGLGKYPEAARYLSEAVGLNPEDVVSRYALGRAMSRDGNLEAAREQMKAVLSLKPGHTEAAAWLEQNMPQEDTRNY